MYEGGVSSRSPKAEALWNIEPGARARAWLKQSSPLKISQHRVDSMDRKYAGQIDPVKPGRIELKAVVYSRFRSSHSVS